MTLASAILSSDGDETMTTVRSRGNESEGIGATSIDQSFKAFHCERSRERYGSLKKANTSALAEEPPAENSLPSEGTAFTHMVGRCSEGWLSTLGGCACGLEPLGTATPSAH